MILTTKARYAVMAMVDLAGRAEGPVALAKLAESQQITLPYLEQLFSKLKQKGLVISVRGPGGGYRLAHAANRLCVLDIIEAVDESIKMTRCETHGARGCMENNARCLTHDLWEGLSENIHHYLRDITLDDILQGNLRGELLSRRLHHINEPRVN